MRKQMMKCAHGRVATHVKAGDKYVYRGCSQCNPPRVTATGRAVSPGHVTRSSLRVRRSHAGKPLPMHLQCHPKALDPTPRNPHCFTYNRAPVKALELQAKYGTLGMSRGAGLKFDPQRFELRLVNGGTLGYTDDPIYATAWRSAARVNGINVEVIDNG